MKTERTNTAREDLLEAGRLTKAGRLLEATALLQRLLQRMTPAGTPVAARREPQGGAEIATPAGAFALPSTVPIRPEAGRREEVRPAMVRAATVRPETVRPQTVRPATVRPAAVLVEPVSPASPARGVSDFLSRSFSNAAGTRSYRLYVPSGYCGEPIPLVVMLHGCTQSAEDFAAGTRMNVVAEERTCFVAYPAQPASANPGRCWNWFKPGDQRRDEGEPSLIAGITRAIAAEYAVDAGRMYVAGLSAGGAAAAVLASEYPELYAALGVHSGVPRGAARDISSAVSVMRTGGGRRDRSVTGAFAGSAAGVPTIIFHGDGDTTVHPNNADALVAQSVHAGLKTTVSSGRSQGGQSYTRTSYCDESGRTLLENWVVHGAGHAWLGGSSAGSYTDARGPDASREMMRFFLEHGSPHERRKI